MEQTTRKGFTLAEVLITLGVIGVIAAMTLPIVIDKYKEQVILSKVKKYYSVFNQSLLMAIKDNGYVNEWSYTDVTEFVNHIKPYLKVSKDCGTKRGCIPNTYYYLNGKEAPTYNAGNAYYKMILSDGILVWFSLNPATGIKARVFIDINGNKAPNTVGIDVYAFDIYNSKITTNDWSCVKNGSNQGFGCAHIIIRDNKVKYIR